MSFDADYDLAQFVRRFLTSHGAEVEQSGGRYHALLPEELAQSLSLPEYCTLNLTSEAPGEFSVQYGQPLLEKMADSACRKVPFSYVRVHLSYLKRQGFDQLIQEYFTFPNAVGRVENVAETLTDYLMLTCRYLLQSDEQKEELVTLGFNLETGAPVDGFAEGLDGMEKSYPPATEGTPLDTSLLERIAQWVHRRAPIALEPRLASFRDSMNRRFRRDAATLEEYYAELGREMQESLNRPGLSQESIQDRRAKIGLIPAEQAMKMEDLLKKYSIKVSLGLCAAMLVRTPAVKVLYRAATGRQAKQMPLFYNPILKAMDPAVCAGCGQGTYHVRFCQQQHLLCPQCAGACPLCAGAGGRHHQN